ncbi:MAG TPA: glycosyltransferase family 1 protein, partial [Gemmataceae bacterium]|nr:glycosyltransferase family 1 protein [Gemmataceae bacterium]
GTNTRRADAAPLAGRTTWRDRLRPLHRALPTDLQHASREGFSALRYLARFLFRSCRTSLTNLGRSLGRAAARLVLRRKDRLLFRDGDVLFVPGASWDDYGAFDALARIKEKLRLSVVPIVYDVIPAKLPQVCQPLLPKLFDPWIRKLLAQSDLILTISRYSRGDLLSLAEELGVPAPPVEVIRLGDSPAGFDRAARPAALPPEVETFALCVGTFEVRKNHWLLYHVWRRLIEQHGERTPPLVLAGRMGWAVKDLLQQIQTDPRVRDRIVILFDVTDEELSWLYRTCLFTLYPSFYEGWGLPVAESLAHGKHCICSNATSVPEVGGDLVDYHDPLDGMRCIELAQRALFEPGYREARENRIRREFRAATWDECTARIVPLMEQKLGVRLTGVAPAASAEAA